MNINQAYRAVLRLASEDVISDRWDMVVVDTFKKILDENLEQIVVDFGSDEQLSAIKVGQDYPMLRDDALSHQNFVSNDTALVVRSCISKARNNADTCGAWEILVDDVELDSFEAIDMVYAHWTAYGEEIMKSLSQDKDPDWDSEVTM